MNLLVNISKNDSYICVILGSIIGFFILILYLKVLSINPNKNIYENIIEVFNNKIGFFINLILITVLISFATLLFHNIINFINSKYLYYTPSIIISLAFVVPIIYLMKFDIKVIARCSIILFFITIVSYFFSLIGLLNQIKFYNLLPFMANDSNSIIKGIIIYVSYVILPIFTILSIPKKSINNSNNFNQKIIKGYIFISILLITTEIFLTSILGCNLISIYEYPAYHLLRGIGVANFIQRIESVLAIQWILCVFFMISFLCYNIKIILKILFKYHTLKYNFIIPLTIMLLSFFMFQSKDYLVSHVFYLLLLFIFWFIIPVLTIIFKKKKSG